ncbi:peroxidase family protein [Streptosporangium sp. NPDC003464]
MRAFARPGRHRTRRGRALSLVALVVAGGLSMNGTAHADDGGVSDRPILGIWEAQSLSGAKNNRSHPDWGVAGALYPRLAPARYADGLNKPASGPNARYVSNRVFNDSNQNLYSERNVSQWAFVWGQFLDHTMAQRLGRRGTGDPGEALNTPFDKNDPLEKFRNDLGVIFFERSAPAPGSGVTSARDQINTISSYIEASAVYGDTDARLDWMREGSVDGNPDNNDARLLMPGNYLPRRDSRGNPDTAPAMVIGGQLFTKPTRAAVTGDQRANENPALLATQTLFAREHNRIVSLLPSWVSQQDKFQIARAVVIAEQQYVTYNEFLPTLGVTLPPYRGYKPKVDATVTNEFATVGYRGHSQIRPKFRITAETGRYSQATLDALKAMNIDVVVKDDEVELAIPLGEDAFFNPDLLEMLQLGPMLHGIGLKAQNKNDEQINNLLRSAGFELSGNPLCGDDPTLPDCVVGVTDLGALDIERGRDHGMPTYNQLRQAYGLPAKTSFKAITGEASDSFPSDPLLTPGNEINDPDSMDFTQLFDINGNPTTAEADNATSGVRRTPLAARLKAVYADVADVDAFVGMMAEPHLPGREFGETQLAIWKREFTALRDGDRFFHANDPLLPFIRKVFGIDYRKPLGDIIALNTDIPRDTMSPNVFFTPQAQQQSKAAPSPSAAEPVVPNSSTRAGNGRAATFRAPGGPAALPVGQAPGVSLTRRARRRTPRGTGAEI